MKYVEACLSAREDSERCFHRCDCPMRLVKACLYEERPDKVDLTSDEVL